jgi:hypothetical protein
LREELEVRGLAGGAVVFRQRGHGLPFPKTSKSFSVRLMGENIVTDRAVDFCQVEEKEVWPSHRRKPIYCKKLVNLELQNGGMGQGRKMPRRGFYQQCARQANGGKFLLS